jgi:hypothetical protein
VTPRVGSCLLFFPSIDDDILNLMDEVNMDEFLKEAAEAIDDPEKLSRYVREKATMAIERFLVRLKSHAFTFRPNLSSHVYLLFLSTPELPPKNVYPSGKARPR